MIAAEIRTGHAAGSRPRHIKKSICKAMRAEDSARGLVVLKLAAKFEHFDGSWTTISTIAAILTVITGL
ncbi:MAG: hypothetical protein UIB39_08500 [Lachnospiraceae bacterium]|nr:hypothetical protein [Lachnospiraceae bacterium]